MCIGIHTYKNRPNIKNKACEVEEVVCVCVWKKRGGGLELYKGIEI